MSGTAAFTPGRRLTVWYDPDEGDTVQEKVGWAATLVRYDSEQGLLVRFDDCADDDPDREAWVDEAGEDEWAWAVEARSDDALPQCLRLRRCHRWRYQQPRRRPHPCPRPCSSPHRHMRPCRRPMTRRSCSLPRPGSYLRAGTCAPSPRQHLRLRPPEGPSRLRRGPRRRFWRGSAARESLDCGLWTTLIWRF